MIIAQGFFYMFIGLFLGFCLGLLEKNSYQPKHMDRYYPVPSGPYEIQRPNTPSQGPRLKYRGGQVEVRQCRRPLPDPPKE